MRGSSLILILKDYGDIEKYSDDLSDFISHVTKIYKILGVDFQVVANCKDICLYQCLYCVYSYTDKRSGQGLLYAISLTSVLILPQIDC